MRVGSTSSTRSSDGARAEAVMRQNVAFPQSAASPSPFSPIADSGFLSNRHTGALVAPDGTVDWLCVPRFDSPSVFGALLDRGAGGFRFGPFGINVPRSRIYEPGTNLLVTSWKQLEATTRFWRNWLAQAAIPDHELGPLIERSALTIKASPTCRQGRRSRR
jgi:GH15 family glucan-1,4-alpha-glucosidase